MASKKNLVVAAGGSAVFVAVLLLSANYFGIDINGATTANAALSADASVGPRGGTVFTSGTQSIEVVFAEQGESVQLEVHPLSKGKPIGVAGVSISGVVKRYDGNQQSVDLITSGQKFVLPEPIAKPHVFDVSLKVRSAGADAIYEVSRADGAIRLAPEQLKASGIATKQSGPVSVASSFVLPGEIRFNEDTTAHIVPRVAGIVEKVSVSLGQRVEKGQVLAVIASTDLADRRSELLTAQRRLSAAQATYSRERTLWQEKISAEQDYLQAQTQLREAEIATSNASQKLQALNASAATGVLNRYELRAPFSGTIVEKHVTAGEAVAADANVLVLSDLASVWAEMAVPAQRLNDVQVGREASVSAAAFDSRATGKITYVGSLLGEQTRTAPAHVVLTNPNGSWRPGMFVNVAVNAGSKDAPVAVATEALHDIDGKPAVFVQTAKGFVAQPVELGRRDESFVEVTKGLKAGQQYAAANSFVLKAELEKGSAEGH
ncbi:efflux RND transporter periplasmic adaptor subunit [Caballeronia sp. DA-9]|uniref:efflux RND transporter periplasmic adaptor subunit n=1 Tax=Caballeronia sp. DA-9 TaxID=3436237 RepID=UPI003F673B30